MPKRRALPFLLACLVSPAFAQAGPTTLPDLMLDELRRSAGVAGMAAAVAKGDVIVWHGESGLADVAANAPVTAKTAFRLGSVSKFVTVAMLARLVDRQGIDLDLPVHAYLPDFPDKGQPFTARQLATHTAGMPHYDEKRDADIDGAPAPFASVSASLRLFQDRPLQHAPGTAYLYSSFGYNLLSAVMERAAGQDFLAQLAETARRARTPSLQPERMGAPGRTWSKLYDASGRELARQNITYKWAGGGLLGNASDLARLGTTVLDPSFITPATLALFTSPARLASGAPVVTDKYTQGLGWRLSSDGAGRSTFHHAGAIPGGRANLAVYPQDRAAIALMTNVQAVIAMEATTEALYDALVAVPPSGNCPEGERRYTGSYDGQDIGGSMRTQRAGRYCRTVIEVDNHLGRRVAPGRAQASVVLLASADEGPAYLVTPVGIFTASAGAGTLSAQVLGRTLQVSLGQDRPAPALPQRTK